MIEPTTEPTPLGSAGPPPPTINIQAKLEQQRKQKIMRQTAQVVREAIRGGKYILGVYFIDGQEKLQKHFFHVAPFPYGDFPVIEQDFRTHLSRLLKARTVPKPPAEDSSPTAVLDDLADGKALQPMQLPDVVDVPPEELKAPSTQTPIAESNEQPDNTPE